MKNLNLLNMTEAAKALGLKSTWVLQGIKIASAGKPDNPWRGRYTTTEWILEWLGNHPEFVAAHYCRQRGRKAADAVDGAGVHGIGPGRG